MIMQMLLAGGKSLIGGGVLTTYGSGQSVNGISAFAVGSNVTTQQTFTAPAGYTSGYAFVIQDTALGIYNFTPTQFAVGASMTHSISTASFPNYASFNPGGGLFMNAQNGAVNTNLSGVVSSPLPSGAILSGFWVGIFFFR